MRAHLYLAPSTRYPNGPHGELLAWEGRLSSRISRAQHPPSRCATTFDCRRPWERIVNCQALNALAEWP